MIKILSRITFIIAVCVVSCCSHIQEYKHEITQDELYSHVDFLASDSLQGRQPGTPFDRVAAKYIKDQMELSGVTLIGKNGYQFFEFITKQKLGYNNCLLIEGKPLKLGTDYSLFSFSSNDTIAAPAVFVGYGITHSENDLIWDDYLTVNALGKWVIMLRDRPKFMREKGLVGDYSSTKYKAQLAMENGALGVIMVSGLELDFNDNLADPQLKQFDIGIPVVQVKRYVLDRLLHPTGKTVASLEQMIHRNQKTQSFNLSQTISARTEIVRSKKNTQNVIGLVEGSDAILKHQFVVVGAHYDHIGLGGENSSSRSPDSIAVHNGADDNASGVAAMLEIAQRIAFHKPKRSVLFIAFGAEELGLLGSRFFVENPPIPLDSISAMLNLDMIGRLGEQREINVKGVGTSLEAESILLNSNHSINLTLKLSPEGYGPSDHANFYSKNIPVLFFTTGPHVDYHTPLDVTQKINFEGLTEISTLIYNTTQTLANLPYRLAFSQPDPISYSAHLGNGVTTIPGIIPDISRSHTNGLKVLDVKEHSPAYYAGFKPNDIIIAINGAPIQNVKCYANETQKLLKGASVSVEVLRDEEPIVMLVLL